MKRVVGTSAAIVGTMFVAWGLAEAGFFWAGARWAVGVVGAGAAGAGSLVTARSIGLAGLGYGAVGAVLGVAWGAWLVLVFRSRNTATGRGSLLSLRVFTSVLGLLVLGLLILSDSELARHPETTQNPRWFQNVSPAARYAVYAALSWGLHRLWFFIGDRLTRPRLLRWLRSRWSRGALGGGLVATAAVLSLFPGVEPPPVERSMEARPPAASTSLPNVVIIVLDTARPDHMSLYGYPRPTTPNLDALGRAGVVFEQAYSTSSWTLPSHASLFTGLYPTEHGATGEHFWLDDRFPTLAERMRSLGYRTWAASGNAMVGSISNLDRGFERFLESWRSSVWTMLSLPRAVARALGQEPDEGAREATTRVREWLTEDGAGGGPYFLFVNLIEAHAPYAPPEPYRSRMLEGRSEPTVDIYGNRFLDYMLGLTEVGPGELEGIRRLYDGELAYVDSRVQEIVEAIKATGTWDRTLLVVTADHGENLGEHRLMDHQLCVYETLTRIPLLVVGPGFRGGKRVDGRVQLHDVFATVLAASGIAASPGRDVDSRDLRAIAAGEQPGREIVVSEYHRPVAVLKMLQKKLELAGRSDGTTALSRFDRTLRAIVRGNWKLIHGSDDRNELFDLAADPGELADLAGAGRSEEAELQARLGDWLQELTAAGGSGGEDALHADDQAKERLRALGYIE